MINIVDNHNCCGCSACASICPKQCISMAADKEGFLYPLVDKNICIECGLCEKVCNELHPYEKRKPYKVLAAINKDEDIRMKSSSGGIFYILAAKIICEGGVVFGARFDENWQVVIDYATDIKAIDAFMGSKYVQARIENAYRDAKHFLTEGRKVLFSGTPCQVAGLKNYIKWIPEHLYLVDLICHGVPSQQMLNEHIHHILKTSAEQLSFRKGQLFRIEITSRCGTVYSSEPYGDTYFRAFLDGISYRKSCYHCPFARKERVSDVTIGDFWGLQDAASLPLEISEGISVLLPSSEKGKSLIAAAKSDMWIYERSVEEAVEGNTQLYRPVHNGLSARLLSMLYPYFPFDKAVRIVIVKDLILESLKNILRSFKPVLMPIINVIRR